LYTSFDAKSALTQIAIVILQKITDFEEHKQLKNKVAIPQGSFK
jgi:hypothetical protein